MICPVPRQPKPLQQCQGIKLKRLSNRGLELRLGLLIVPDILTQGNTVFLDEEEVGLKPLPQFQLYQ